MPITTPSFLPSLLGILTFISIFPVVSGQAVVVRRRRIVGPVVAGCVIGSLFIFSLLLMCCILARRRRSKNFHGEETNVGPGLTSGGTRIVAIRTRPVFWGRRRGPLRGARVIAVSSRGGVAQPAQKNSPSPIPSTELPMKENKNGAAIPSPVQPPPPYTGQIPEEAICKRDSFAQSRIGDQIEEAH